MSNRLTFSLASLVLIFALAFAGLPAMAEDGGPTVTIAQGTDKDRDDFDLTFTFSHPVEAQGSSGGTLAFAWRLVDAQTNLLGTAAETGSADQTADSRTKYTATLDIPTAAAALNVDAVKVIVSVAENLKTGTTAGNSKRNQPAEMTFNLPPVQGDTTVEVTAEAVANEPGAFTVTFEFSADPSPAFTANNISIPATGVTIVDGSFTAVSGSTTNFTAKVQLAYGVTGAMVGVDPGYAKPKSAGSNFVTLPLPAPKSPVRERPPMVDIEIGDYTAEPRAFRIDITFTPQSKSDGTDGDDVMVDADTFHEHAAFKVEDSADREITPTKLDASAGENMYSAILQYGPLAVGNLPLTISIDPNDIDEKYKATDAKPNATPPDPGIPDADPVTKTVGGDGTGTPTPTPGAPAVPMNVVAVADQDADTITVTWDAVTDAVSYEVTKHYTAADGTAATKVLPDADNTDTTITIPPAGEEALAHGVAFTFTVTATNAAGTSAASAMSNSVTITAPPANNAPVFLTGTTIADISARVGMAITSMELPLAAEVDAGDTVTYSLSPALPAGLMFDAATRMLSGTPTAAMAETEYTYTATDTLGGMATLMFDITVTANNAPAFATGATIADVSAREGIAVSVTLPGATDADSDAITYTLSPTLPAGLTRSGMVISGTPTTAMAATPYTWTASDGIDSNSLMFNITVAADRPPMFAVGTSISTVSATVGMAITPLTLPPATDADNDAITYSLTPSPPTGLTFNAATRLLSGTPRAVSPATAHTYTATANGQPVSLSFAIVVSAEPSVTTPGNKAPAFADDASISTIAATAGTAITPLTLPRATDADGDAITYSLTPRLPVGLTFNPTSRLLSGTPSAAMAVRSYTYTASARGGSDMLSFAIVVNAGPDMPDPIVLPHPNMEIHGTFVPGTGKNVGVTTFTRGSINPNSFGVVLADALPDLEDFFRQKGTIVLDDGRSTPLRTVVISEILWGLDAGEPAATQDRRQFIELYNTNRPTDTNPVVDVRGWRLIFTLGRPAPARDVDRVSNAGTIVDTGWFMDVGQSGVLTGTTLAGVSALGGQGVPIDIVSMYRNINYGGAQSAAGDRLKDGHIRLGHHKASWKASTRITTQVGIKASPGARHFVELGVLSKTKVPFEPFVINEIGNDTGGASDWIELRNVTATQQSLKNYMLSVATGVGAESLLFHFHDKDYKVPANGVVLVTSTDPRDNDLAGGDDLAKGQLDEELEGATHLYVVRSFNLPDSGKTLLILRKDYNNKPGDFLPGKKLDKIIDAVGTLRADDPLRGTSLWPLHVWDGPHNDVNNDDGGHGHEDFRAGYVYKRDKVNQIHAEHTVNVHGYTGVGYDRFAATTLVNGGTPGYDNGAVKSEKSNWAGQVSISEIMLATEVREGEDNVRVPRATKLPQWFEIYNASLTEAVNINNWYLEIQNDDSGDLRVGRLTGDPESVHPRNLHGTLRLPNVTIQPNQTILIVSSRGTQSTHFPEHRTINLFTNGTYRSLLNLRARGDSVLSQEGFYLELRDHKGHHVDEIGNLGVSRRTTVSALRADNFGGEWYLTDDGTETGTPILNDLATGHRTSLIRVYYKGEPGLRKNGRAVAPSSNEIPGLMRNGWIQASKVNFRNVPGITYYGNQNDFGTPGYRGGGPLPVQLSKFRPERLDSGEVVVRWITESELNNAGFNILRTETRDGAFQQVNTELIKGHGTTSERNSYTWTDKTAKPNVVYYYQIQDVSLDGQVQTLRISRLKGNISAEGKVTTTWGSLKLQD